MSVDRFPRETRAEQRRKKIDTMFNLLLSRGTSVSVCFALLKRIVVCTFVIKVFPPTSASCGL